MWVDITEVERRVRGISVRKSNEHGTYHTLASLPPYVKHIPLTIDSRISLIGRNIRLDSLPIVQTITRSDVGKRRICDVQLADPENEFWGSSTGRCDIRVIWSNSLPRVLPCKENLSSRVRKRNRSVLGDRSRAIETRDIIPNTCLIRQRITGWSSWPKARRLIQSRLARIPPRTIRLIQHRQRREILPNKSLGIRRTLGNIRRKKRPSPGLWNPGLEPDRHGEQACELTEDHLLAGFGGN